jgi:hypothetical protein
MVFFRPNTECVEYYADSYTMALKSEEGLKQQVHLLVHRTERVTGATVTPCKPTDHVLKELFAFTRTQVNLRNLFKKILAY